MFQATNQYMALWLIWINGIDVGYHHHLEVKIDGIDMDWLSMGYPAIHGLSYIIRLYVYQ